MDALNGKDMNYNALLTKLEDLKSCQDTTQLAEFYNEWSSYYEKMVGVGQYNAHFIACDEANLLISENERPGCIVLDVAAGTGWLGRELFKSGFRNLDAVEPSKGMLKLLEDTGYYKTTFNEGIGECNTKTSIPSGHYDVVMCAGGMGPQHIPTSGIDHFINFTKRGGLVIIVMKNSYIEYIQELQSRMDQFEKEGVWKKVLMKVVPNYYLGHDGIVYIYRVLQQQQ